MIEKTKTVDGLLLVDTETGQSVGLFWEEVGELVVFVEEELRQVGARGVDPVTDALERGIAAGLDRRAAR